MEYNLHHRLLHKQYIGDVNIRDFLGYTKRHWDEAFGLNTSINKGDLSLLANSKVNEKQDPQMGARKVIWVN